MTLGQGKEPLSWKATPFLGLLTVVLASIQEKGLVAMIRVQKSSDNTKVETVFDWDSPEYSDLFQRAKETKARR